MDSASHVDAWIGGSRQALDALIPEVYRDLRRLADGYLRRERRDHTLQTTALVHEAYLRLIGQRKVSEHNRTQFVALAAQMMRRVLVNYAVARQADKRGGPERPLSIEAAGEVALEHEGEVDVLALHEALDELERLDPRQAQIVELRYFGGMSVDETAAHLQISPATVHRDWATARLWLHRALSRPGPGTP